MMHARRLVIKILNRIEDTGAYADIVLANELSGRNMPQRDRHLVTELVNGTIRWQSRLDWIILLYFSGDYEKCPQKIRTILRTALYQIIFLSKVPDYAAISEAVSLAKKLKGAFWGRKVNAILRSISKHQDEIEYPDAAKNPVKFLSVRYSHPEWMVSRWLERFGFEQTKSLLKSNNNPPKHTLRVNRLRISVSELQGLLLGAGIKTKATKFVNECLIVDKLPNLDDFDLFQRGLFSVQDESAALVGGLVDPQPGELILDLCSAPGGKATHLAEIAGNGCKIIAVDLHLNRLQLVSSAARRLGHKNIFPVNANAAHVATAKADKILIDAPCTGLGVLSKRSDARWKRTPGQLAELVTIQRKILDNASKLLKNGGYLIYSTCTTEPEENEQQIARFLRNHPEFKIDFPMNRFNKELIIENKYIYTFPHIHHMDGSFATRLVKTG
ncbi:16S rRNA (cytosine(967)-C(5))-methyltransferase RsmB [candidate division KSB1 bacterium]|nr:16S rRNA (cytosine(967)-C(5))-methyltransferase RsmB [candidate division KSB1 bacterium]